MAGECLCNESDRFASHSGLSGALQFAAEQPTDSPRRAIDRGKEVGTAFMDLYATEGQDLSANAATLACSTFSFDTYNDLTNATTKTPERKSQPSLHVRFESFGKISVVNTR